MNTYLDELLIISKWCWCFWFRDALHTCSTYATKPIALEGPYFAMSCIHPYLIKSLQRGEMGHLRLILLWLGQKCFEITSTVLNISNCRNWRLYSMIEEMRKTLFDFFGFKITCWLETKMILLYNLSSSLS